MDQGSGQYIFETASFFNNFVSGVSLIILSLTLQIIRTGVIRKEYERAIAALFGAFGLHCLFVAFNAPVVIKTTIDSVMTILSLSIGTVILYDAIREAWPNVVKKFWRG